MAEEPLIPLSAVTWIGEGLSARAPNACSPPPRARSLPGTTTAASPKSANPGAKLSGRHRAFWRCHAADARLPARQFGVRQFGPGGGAWRLDRDWRLFPHLFEADGELLRVC